MATWQGNLKGGWRVENVRPLDGDPIMRWQGEVTFGEDDIQTLQWTAEGLYYAWEMSSPYDLNPTMQKDNYSWQDLDLDEIPELAFQLVQTRKPIEVRLRACAADDWSNEQLVGFRLDLEGEYGTGVVYFVDTNGGEWLYCQVYRQPVAA